MPQGDTRLRKRINQRWSALERERSSWLAHWRDLSEYVLPRTGRFLVNDRNKGDKRHNKILDSTGTRALRTLASGMMAGMTSPARPWFRLTTSNPDLDDDDAVRVWLSEVTRIMQMIFAKSNTYRALHSTYEELGLYGTSSGIVVADYNTVIHHHMLTAGEYAIATGAQGSVDTVYREFQMTVGQMMAEFGKSACSDTVRNLYDKGAVDQWIDVMHAIEPRRDGDPAIRGARNMPWRSAYVETGSDNHGVLRESGFETFPGLCPRWALSGGDIYGNSPGMEALGDIQQLQHEQLRKGQGIDYQTNPPLQVPTALKGKELDTLPGGVSYYDQPAATGGIRSAFEVQLDLQALLADIVDIRERIKASFYADLFLMLTGDNIRNMTATEVAERHEEKLLMLGPVLERLHNEILDPLIEITFERMVRTNLVPPPPEAMQGQELNVEFVSMLAQAQRAVATNAVDRYVANLGNIAQIKPDVLDKFDSDYWADSYADMLGVDPKMIVPGEQVALIRQQRAEAAQQQQQMEQLQQGAGVAKDLAAAKTGEDSALTSVMDGFTGYT